MNLEEARNKIGASVIYHDQGYDAERGIITTVGDLYIFVRYDSQPADAPGQATSPQMLTLIKEAT